MKSLMLFLQYLLADCGRWCCTSTSRDYKTISSRVEHEGLSFLTITLPNFGKDFEKSLDQGKVTHDLFQGFSWKGGLPKLFSGFLELVFDRCSGRLLDDPSVTAIFCIRQLSLAFSKIRIDCSEERVNAAIEGYLQCESDIRSSDALLSRFDMAKFGRIARLLWSDVFQQVDEDIYYDRIIPKHGPGTTAESTRGNAKWNQRMWTSRLEDVFPAMEYISPSSWGLRKEFLEDAVDYREPGAELPVRVIAVPKTLKTPRIIAAEPVCMMFIQQGIAGSITKSIRNSRYGSMISAQSQEPNQLLACEGSLWGHLATLDLSEASDRVSYQHVREMIGNFPNLARGVDASRSRKADVFGRQVIRLAKFASMGSALCFPFEAFVFSTLIFVGIEKELNRPITHEDIESFMGAVRVYGDDIIIPVDFVHSVIETLELFGYKVNSSKSFWIGKFRESCGREYYDGHDVSITRVRSLIPSSRRHVEEIIRTVALRNHLYSSGMWAAAGYLDSVLERLIPFPYVESTSPLLGRNSFVRFDQPTKEDPNLHKPLVKGVKVVARLPIDYLDGIGALAKCLTALEIRDGEIFVDLEDSDPLTGVALPGYSVDHLERAGRPRIVDIKTRWESPR